MFRIITKILVILSVIAISACSTGSRFIIPDGSQLYLDGRSEPVVVQSNGMVRTRPFDWKSMGIPPKKGIPYRLESEGKTIKEGKLRTVFRGASLFWPPIYGIISWPVGLNPHITYNLITNEQK